KSAVARFDDVDVIAAPTAMFTPAVMTQGADTEKTWARNRNLVHNVAPANYLGLCAATLPVGPDRLGMPVGLQFIAKGGDDERLVAIACAAERVLGTPREILGAPPMCKGERAVKSQGFNQAFSCRAMNSLATSRALSVFGPGSATHS